jgi:predicted transcriptional regulator
MLTLAFLSYDFPVLKLTDSIQKAMKAFHTHELTNLAVLDGKKYVGNITEELLANSSHPDGNLSELTSIF